MWYIRLKQTRVNPILTLSYFKKRYIRIEYFLELCVVFFRIAPETRLLSAQHTQYMRLEQAVYVQNRLCIRTFKGVVGREHANHVQIVRIQNEIKTFWAWVARPKCVQLCNTFFHYWQRIGCGYEILQSQLIRIGYTDKCDRALGYVTHQKFSCVLRVGLFFRNIHVIPTKLSEPEQTLGSIVLFLYL